MNDLRPFALKCLVAVAIAFGMGVLLLGLWTGRHLVLLVFAGLLFALLLRGLADQVQKHTPLGATWALVAVLAALCAVLTGLGFWMVPSLSDQTDQLIENLPHSLESLRSWLGQTGWGRQVLKAVPQTDALLAHPADMLSRVQGAFSLTFGVVFDAVVLLFIGLFLAMEPKLYRGGLVRLVPLRSREHVASVLAEIGAVLQHWLWARFTVMFVVGTLTGLGLWALGVPLALPLAVITMALGFIPNLGPILAALPAVLMGLLDGPYKALYVVLLYLAVQGFEGYLLTPFLQRRAIAIPPALLIASQVFLGLIFGFLGLLLATPLTAVAIVLVQRFYRADVLEDPSVKAAPGESET